MAPVRVVDLFSCAGGFSQGASELDGDGCEVVLAVDNDPACLDAHEQNHPQTRHLLRTMPDDSLAAELPSGPYHLHASPPCTRLSSASRLLAIDPLRKEALALVRWTLDFILKVNPASFSLEQVCAPAVRELLQEYKAKHPATIDWEVVNMADYGVPQTRRRVIVARPEVMRLLRERKVPWRSILDVMTPPTTHIRNHLVYSRDKKGVQVKHHPRKASRRCDLPAYTQVAARPLFWSDSEGSTLRCLTQAETALLQTFPPGYTFPPGSRPGLGAVGNAVPPRMARAIMECVRDSGVLDSSVHG